ncbi:MAG: hypothetical protein NVS2B4_07670 [Ramlibacter sp.]
MDEADLAFDSEQRYLSQALAAQARSRVLQQPTGCCQHCGNTEGLDDRLFCDRDCADDWEYERALRRKLGVAAPAPLH